jgi:group I intron endonuclease
MSKGVICGIYKISTPSNKVYIGQSLDIYKRWNSYMKLQNCKGQAKLLSSFKSHGVENCSFEIIEECEESNLNEREIYWIEFYNTFDTTHGLNLRGGGANGRLSLSTKAKISRAGKGRVAWNKGLKNPNPTKGRKMSEEQKQKISNSKKGVSSWNKGKITSLETRLKISKANKGRISPNKGKTPSEETRRKIGEGNKGKYGYWNGRKISEGTKKKISNTLKKKLKK